MNRPNRLREKLRDLATALRDGGEPEFADQVEAAAVGTEEKLETFITSNDLWGGAGSIADQAGYFDRRTPQRRKIEMTLIALGQEQTTIGRTNVRTQMWVHAFEHWAKLGL